MKAIPSSVDKASGAGRPRDPRIDAAILTATADLLVQIGYSNLTLAAVAERARAARAGRRQGGWAVGGERRGGWGGGGGFCGGPPPRWWPRPATWPLTCR